MEQSTSPQKNDKKEEKSKELKKEYTFDEAIEIIGFGKYQLFILSLTGLAWFAVSVQYTLTPTLLLIINQVSDDMTLTPVDKSMIAGSTVIGTPKKPIPRPPPHNAPRVPRVRVRAP